MSFNYAECLIKAVYSVLGFISFLATELLINEITFVVLGFMRENIGYEIFIFGVN